MTHIAEKPAIVKLTLGKLLALSAYIYVLDSLVIGLISLTKWYLFSEDFIKPLLQRQVNLLGSVLHCIFCFSMEIAILSPAILRDLPH